MRPKLEKLGSLCCPFATDLYSKEGEKQVFCAKVS